MAKVAKKKDPFAKSKKPVTKQKLKLSDLTNQKAIAASVRNSVTQEHVDKLNELFEKNLGEMVRNSNQFVLPAIQASCTDEEGNQVPGYRLPIPPTAQQLHNQIYAKLSGADLPESTADIEWREQDVPSSNGKLSMSFESSVILAAIEDEKYFNMFFSQTLLTMMNIFKDRVIGFGPAEVPYFGTHYFSFTSAQPTVFVLDEGNTARVTLTSDVAKYIES